MKKRFGSKLLSMALSLALAASAAGSATAFAADTADTVTVYHTNDIHGKVNSTYDSKSGALTQIGMDVLKSAKANTPGSLLVDAGDATQGVALASYSKGSDVIKLMNAAGYDAMTFGNHEFDYGSAVALENAKNAAFPVIAANVMNSSGTTLVNDVNTGKAKNSGDVYDPAGGWMIKSVNGKKIGFFGITTCETAFKTNPNNLQGVTFRPEVETAKAQVAALQAQGADAVIGVMHVGIDSSSNPTSHVLAQQVPGIDVIIDGHSHSTETTTVGTTLIQQTGTGASKLGKLVLNFSGGKVSVTASLMTPAEVGAAFKADASVTKLYDDMSAALKPTLEQTVGATATSLYGGTYNGTSVCRIGETNLGNLVADAMIYGAGELLQGKTKYEGVAPIVSLENGGGVRTTLPAGKLTVGDVINVLPFGNSLSLKEVTPKTLYEVLENGVSNDVKDGVVSALGAFPQVGGMRFEADLSKPVGSRVTKIVLLDPKTGNDSKTLSRTDTSTVIVLVSNDFEVAGGDGYTMLKNLPYIAEGSALDIVTANYIRQMTEASNAGALTYHVENRIKLTTNGGTMPAYNASVTVKQDGSALANTSVDVQIDSNKAIAMKTDAAGKLSVTLDSGPHNIIVHSGSKQGDAFVNDLAKALLTTEVSMKSVEAVGAGESSTSYAVVNSDTTATFNLPVGKKYTFKVSVLSDEKPEFATGDAKVLTGNVARVNGKDTYYYQITAVSKGGTGVYCTANGQRKLLCYVNAA